MPLANVNGVDLFYEESGSGEPIIFQHGYTGAHESWDGVIERMRGDYRCIAMDARGAGDSSHPEDGHTIEQMAADVVGMADALGIERFNYVGQSMGGTIGFELGLSHAERLRSLTLSAPGPADGVKMDAAARAQGRAVWAAKDRESMIRTMTPMVPRAAAREKIAHPGRPDAVSLRRPLRRLLGRAGRLPQGRPPRLKSRRRRWSRPARPMACSAKISATSRASATPPCTSSAASATACPARCPPHSRACSPTSSSTALSTYARSRPTSPPPSPPEGPQPPLRLR